jgi:ribonuclease D
MLNAAFKAYPFQPQFCRYVADLSTLLECVRDLNSSAYIAVDLEHHSQRSFLGIVCLMQLSTPNCDYIIDTLVFMILRTAIAAMLMRAKCN